MNLLLPLDAISAAATSASASASTSLNKIIIGAILGLVQGISEWLPISSKTQLLLASNFLLNLDFAQAYTLGLFLEGGTFIAAVIYFRRELWHAILAIFRKGGKEGWLLLRYLLVVTVVTAVIAVPIYKAVEELSGPVIGVPMIVLGVMLIVDGLLIKLSRVKFGEGRKLQDLKIKDLLIIGISQGIAALPGISRSGITVSSMILLKTDPQEAFRLSFFALIPASIGATGVTVLFSHETVAGIVDTLTLPALGVAIAISIVVSLLFIRGLIKFAGHRRITSLVYILGAIAIFGGIVALVVGRG